MVCYIGTSSFVDTLLRVFVMLALSAKSFDDRRKYASCALQQVSRAWRVLFSAANDAALHDAFAKDAAATTESDTWKHNTSFSVKFR